LHIGKEFLFKLTQLLLMLSNNYCYNYFPRRFSCCLILSVNMHVELQEMFLIEKVLHARLRFFTHSGLCNLLYALFIFKQVRHTCCLSLHVFIVSHATICFCMFLVGYPQTPEPVIPPDRLAQIDLSCVDVP